MVPLAIFKPQGFYLSYSCAWDQTAAIQTFGTANAPSKTKQSVFNFKSEILTLLKTMAKLPLTLMKVWDFTVSFYNRIVKSVTNKT